MQHCEVTKHHIMINLQNLMVYCQSCKDDLDSQVEVFADSKPQLVEKMSKFIDSVKQIIFKIKKNIRLA